MTKLIKDSNPHRFQLTVSRLRGDGWIVKSSVSSCIENGVQYFSIKVYKLLDTI